MALYQRVDFADMAFSLYFMGYPSNHEGSRCPDAAERSEFTFQQSALLELTHNWGTEDDDSFEGYHDGNTDPRGFGHIGITVPDVDAACQRFEQLGVEFVKRPNDGTMKGLAFIKDPDGYWIEILNADSITGAYRRAWRAKPLRQVAGYARRSLAIWRVSVGDSPKQARYRLLK